MLNRWMVGVIAMLALSACQDEAASGGGGTRDQIKVVGSSTVYPFTTIVAEQFVSRTPGVKAPVIESTGTGSGIKLFCEGVGAQHPDIVGASRRMKSGEFSTCERNGVAEIIEIPVGLDGVAFGESKQGPKLELTTVDIYKALAATPNGKPNTARTWRDVNPAMPAIPIQVYGPPSTSGTRDALAELILAKGCEALRPEMVALKESKPDDFKAQCEKLREDGAFIDAGENDNLIIQKLQANPNAIGIFGYSYLEENLGSLNGVPLNGVSPTYETIAQSRYPGGRPLYIYIKKSHLDAIPGLKQFVDLYIASWGPEGPLVAKGLITLPQAARDAARQAFANRQVLTADQLN